MRFYLIVFLWIRLFTMVRHLVQTSLKIVQFSTNCSQLKFPKVKPNTFPTVYDSVNVEKDWYDWWESNEFFRPSKTGERSFCLVLPPPNVTGTLHLGHALTVVIQDVLSRWHRMRKAEVLWVPGTDHAGIATQVVVEKHLMKKKNLRRLEIGREEFLNEVWKWKEEKGGMINQQLRSLGASLDWSRETFTLNESHSRSVNEAIIRLWDDGLIYRKNALVNWSCSLQSAISDIEVENKTISAPTEITLPGYKNPVEFGMIDEFAYKLVDSDEEIIVSTTRVETVLGDVAVAVHPSDDRYKKYLGTKLLHPLHKTEIPIICDDAVDINFGTGAVKITPSHDHIDFDIATRHKLPSIPVINERGELHNFPGSRFSGMKRFEARVAVREELKRLGLLRNRRPHEHQLPFCSRSGDVVEYLPKPQWFIRCKDMAERAANAVKSGDLEIHPDSFKKDWLHWLENIKDWCISRQLWWGHQLPLYKATARICSSEPRSIWIAAHSLAEAESKAVSILNVPLTDISIEQDLDVLDTWFSSGILPFAVFGWPKKSEDFQRYYPLTTMVTGHDILFFWVARMVMLGLQLTGELPFKKVLLHGIICDSQGRKMSKSLGNVINPGDIVKGISLDQLKEQVNANYEAGLITLNEKEKALSGQKELFPSEIPNCGTDALRFTLLSQNIYKHFVQFDVQECIANRSFCNKIWQAFRYTHSRVSELKVEVQDASVLSVDFRVLPLMDQWILSRLSEAVGIIEKGLEMAEFSVSTDAFKRFFYNDFCDIYLESTKPLLKRGYSEEANKTCLTLVYCLDAVLKVLSPFMPFLTEELNNWLPGNRYKTIFLAEFPSQLKYRNLDLESEIELVIGVITTIRRIKALNSLQKTSVDVIIESKMSGILRRHTSLLDTLLKDNCTIIDYTGATSKEMFICEPFRHHTRIHIPRVCNKLSEDELQKLSNKEVKINKALSKLLQTVEMNGYKEKAPAEVQSAHKEKILDLREELAQLRKKLDYSSVESKNRSSK